MSDYYEKQRNEYLDSLKNPKYFKVDEVSIIVKPEDKDGKTFFYDLCGNRVTKISRKPKDTSIVNDCYLGLKKFKNSERWVPIKSEDVDERLSDDEFIKNHSKEYNPEKVKTKKKGNIKSSENKKIEFNITDELVDYVQKDKTKFFDDFLNFVKSQNQFEISEYEDVVYVKSRHSIGWRKSLSIDFKRDYIRSFKIEITVEDKYKKIKKETNFWGVENKIEEIELRDFVFNIYPFVLELEENSHEYEYVEFRHNSKSFSSKVLSINDIIYTLKNTPEITQKKINYESINLVLNFLTIKIEEYKEKFNSSKITLEKEIKSLDSDNNGVIDVIESSNDLMKLLSKNQSKIVSTDKTYIQKFIKLFNFLKRKRENIQLVFELIQETEHVTHKMDLMGILRNSINSYNELVVHSINMIVSIKNDDFITFYEIYEMFDKLNVFNSNWENEVSQKLSDIGDGLLDLMYSIQKMEVNITNELNTLSYITQESFKELGKTVTDELQSINSSIKFNNLLTGISTYQLYKINKQTNGLIQ